MNPIVTPSLPREKKRLICFVLLCSFAFTSVALGGVNLIRFAWPTSLHPWSNSPTSAVLEAEWIVYPNGLEMGGVGEPHDFYLVATTPRCVEGGEILFRYGTGFPPYFGITDCDGPSCPPNQFRSLNDSSLAPYIGTRVIDGQSFSVFRYRLSYRRTTGPATVNLVCTNYSAKVGAASNGASLPQSTINVFGTVTFPSSGSIQIITSTGSPSITYTGTTLDGNGFTKSFTGCSGGTGTLATNQPVGLLSGNTTNATHFRNIIELYRYADKTWDPWYDHEFDRTSFLHDYTACGTPGADWGPMFESNICPPGGPLPPIGVTDMLVSVNDGRLVRGNTTNAIYEVNLNACDPPARNPYVVWSFLPNYRWIIQSAP